MRTELYESAPAIHHLREKLFTVYLKPELLACKSGITVHNDLSEPEMVSINHTERLQGSEFEPVTEKTVDSPVTLTVKKHIKGNDEGHQKIDGSAVNDLHQRHK
ncbi:MAG: hypothetical protein BWY95_00835 [Bacteroidetes bacterium ADurb.BinA104]|nr:MAG: hypothetical protein BWY95_00835 [Bacteroidetes bacterium ADurb.BinA104]